MPIPESAARGSNQQTADRVFVIRAIGLRSTIDSATLKYPLRQSGMTEYRVSYSRLGQEIRRITLQGGTIASIRPLGVNDDKTESLENELPWWVQISTQQPNNQFYFGPFGTSHEAESQVPGYVADLNEEGAEDITFEIQQCQPEQLTIALSA